MEQDEKTDVHNDIEQLKGAAAAVTTDSFTFQIFRRQRLSFHDMRGQSLVHVRVLAGRQEVQQVLVHQIRLRHRRKNTIIRQTSIVTGI